MKKVLITDDSAFMRAIVQNALKSLDVEFFQAENGDVAVDLYKEVSPDLVFLDVIMPVKNGIVALQEIKEVNPDAVVIVVTSVGQEEMIDKAKELGAADFIPKPFKPDQLKEVAEKYL